MLASTATPTTPEPPSMTGPDIPEPAGGDTNAVRYLQQALEDLDKARERAGDEAKQRIDSACERIRATVHDVRGRAGDVVDDWEAGFDRSTDDLLRELAVRAIHAQQTPEALTELGRELRKRRAELTAKQG